MVNTWKEGHVKIDGIFMEIPMEGIYFYRDKKMLANTVKEFVKDEEDIKK